MSIQDTSALLLGSWEIYRGRLTRDGNIKRVDKKGGIKRTFTKKGEPVPDGEWAEGDLDYMERLMNRKDIEVFHRLSYLEHKADGTYAGGKDDILEKIERFFEQNDKTRFVLYFTGHGTKDDGSWCIPVTTRRKKSRASTLVEEPRQGHSEPAPHGTPADDEAAGQEIEAEVHDKSDSEGDDGKERHEGQEDHAAATQTPPPANKISQRHEPQSGSAQGSLSSIVSSYVIIDHAGNFPDPDSDRPDPTNRWNDFITYEDVIELWDKHKEGKGERFLMMILDCCHSGMWVDKVNGRSIDDYDAEPEDAAAEHHPQNHKRNDVCIQASCRPVEESMVAYNQCSSFFTRGFVKAQERTAFEKAILSLFDHVFVFNAVSFGSSPIIQPFTPISSDYGPFGGIEFFDSFDDMYLQT